MATIPLFHSDYAIVLVPCPGSWPQLRVVPSKPEKEPAGRPKGLAEGIRPQNSRVATLHPHQGPCQLDRSTGTISLPWCLGNSQQS
jgi:hypothetical protein